MNAVTLSLPDTSNSGSSRPARRVEIEFREGAGDGTLSPSELEALGPVLPELVAELLAVSSLHEDPER